jgi:hypothetical protein
VPDKSRSDRPAGRRRRVDSLGGGKTVKEVAAGPPERAAVILVKDPCEFAGEDALKTLLNTGLSAHFPVTKNRSGGRHVRVSRPEVTDTRCPSLAITVRAHIRYWTTRGIQYSTSGEIRFVSPLEARIRHRIVSGGSALQVSDVVKAEACLTNIDVVAVNLDRIPNWLDDGWIKEQVVDPALDSKCFDVTDLVNQFIVAGGVIVA